MCVLLGVPVVLVFVRLLVWDAVVMCDACAGFVCTVSQYERQQREKMELEESRKQAMVAMAMVCVAVGCH